MQKLVADGVAKGIIDVFEIIEVQKQDLQVAAMRGCLGNCVVQSRPEQQPVGQAGQGVVFGQIRNFGQRGRLRLSRIMQHDDGAAKSSVMFTHGSDGQFDGGLDSVAA